MSETCTLGLQLVNVEKVGAGSNFIKFSTLTGVILDKLRGDPTCKVCWNANLGIVKACSLEGYMGAFGIID